VKEKKKEEYGAPREGRGGAGEAFRGYRNEVKSKGAQTKKAASNKKDVYK